MRKIGKEAIDFFRLNPNRLDFKGEARALFRFESEYDDGAEA